MAGLGRVAGRGPDITRRAVLRPAILATAQPRTALESAIDGFCAARPDPSDAAADLRLSCSTGLAEYPLREGRRLGIAWEDTVELAGAALRWVQGRNGDGWAVLRPTMLAEVPQIAGDLSRDAVDSLLRVGRLHLDAAPSMQRSTGMPA